MTPKLPSKLVLAILLLWALSVGLLAQDTLGAIGHLFGRTDTNSNLYVRLGTGTGVVQERRAISSLVGKVDTNSNLYVVQDPTVPAVMGNPSLFADGTAPAPSISFASEPTKGFYSNTVGQIAVSIGSAARAAFTASGLSLVQDAGTILFGTTADATLGRTAAGALYAGTATVQPVINGTLTTSTTGACTIANTTETDLWTYTLPAGALSANGRGVRVTVFGTTAANANLKDMRIYFGAQNIGDTGSLAFNSKAWRFDAVVLRTSATAQVANSYRVDVNAYPYMSPQVTPAETMANAIVIRTTGQNATAAANDICFSGAIVETIR